MNHTSPVSVPVSAPASSHLPQSHAHRWPLPLLAHGSGSSSSTSASASASLHGHYISSAGPQTASSVTGSAYGLHHPNLNIHPPPPHFEADIDRFHYSSNTTHHYTSAPGTSTLSPISNTASSSTTQTRPVTATATLSGPATALPALPPSSSRLVPIHRIPAPAFRAYHDSSPLYIGSIETLRDETHERPQRPIHPRAYTNPEGLPVQLPSLPHISSLAERRPHLAPPSALQIAPYPAGEVRRASAADILSYSGYLHPASALDRTLRSPHPPLTAALVPHGWAAPPQPEFAIPFAPASARPYHSSPLDAPPSAVILPPPIPSAYSSHSPVLPLPNSASPLFIPAPLRFDYSTSPPSTDPRAHVIMPRAAQATRTTASNGLRRTNGHAASNVTSVSGWGSYTAMSHEPGRRIENPIYVPSDTPEIPRKRTRAMAAAEAAADRNAGSTASRASKSFANGSIMGGSVASVQMASQSSAQPKKRKVEEPRTSTAKKPRAPAKPSVRVGSDST